MKILGISAFYHDSAAALLEDSELVAASEEERFNREKHYKGFPEQAAEYCLDEAGVYVEDLDYVVFYEKPFRKFERILRNMVRTFPSSRERFVENVPELVRRKLFLKEKIREELGYGGEILFTSHHKSHIASSFLVSPFEEAAILSIDATGEKVTTALGKGEENSFDIFETVEFPHSLGLFYSTFTSFLGFHVNGGEGKIMGMAAYGEPKYYDFIMDEMIDIREDGGYRLDTDYLAYHYRDRMYSDKFLEKFGEPRSRDREGFDQRHADIAASIQKVLEEALLKITDHLYRETDTENLCLSGGVALNCVANGRIKRETEFENLFIQGAAGDDGGSLGSLFAIYNGAMDNPREFQMENLYWGPSYTEEEVSSVLEREGLGYERMDDDELLPLVAERLAQGDVVGWFQGRMEFGPRALGNRSILADPREEESRDRINESVKFREEWRPFAPTILKDKADRYLEEFDRSPFMIRTYDVKSDKIPAVTHADGTTRPQTVTREQNRRFYDLIQEFGDRTGVYALLNTSFNRRGEPIVRSPENAVECFDSSEMDVLLMENLLVEEK